MILSAAFLLPVFSARVFLARAFDARTSAFSVSAASLMFFSLILPCDYMIILPPQPAALILIFSRLMYVLLETNALKALRLFLPLRPATHIQAGEARCR